MGSRGGSAPNPYTARRISTRFLRVPVGDWPAVKIGRKTEFRRPVTQRSPQFLYAPTPVVAYAARGQTYDHRLMVLDSVHEEPLWQIKDAPESLAREGFDTYEEFRDYWKRRMRKYLPLSVVHVYSVRPLKHEDQTAQALELMALGGEIIKHLYGEFLGT